MVVLNSGLCPHSLSRPGVLGIMLVVAELPRWCHKGGGNCKLTRATRVDGAVPQFLKSIRAPPHDTDGAGWSSSCTIQIRAGDLCRFWTTPELGYMELSIPCGLVNNCYT